MFFHPKKGKVLLLLIDGLRWDQFGLDIPSLQRLENYGVKADWLDSVFLTNTVPNMYSLATGLYPESHGVIHNQFFNAKTHTLIVDYDDVSNITEFFDTGVEPLWVSAILAGKKVACFMWAGTAVPVKGVQCDHVTYQNSWNRENYLPKDQVKDAVLWIVEEDFDLVLLALELPDKALHKSGIDSDQFHSDLWKVDSILNCLLDDIDQRGLWETLNVIVVSDHGHATVDPEKFISLTDYIDEGDIEFSVVVNSLFQLKARAAAENKVLRQLRSAHPALHVFKKENFPERFHYGNHPRNLPIIGYVDIGWHVHLAKKFDPSKDFVNASDHGYDNENMEMKAIFYARGPAFKSSYRAKPLKTVG
ncbi:Ectonucleotide pyrophosphatase/phosphodiesterase family member 7 [Holothuria leucospilota]|uniref:Ectonucleotide pyrophosphatase/phosphodiesterase family member 7 n=1 Tax=Holothuria leucospilota TaxID=206669 RepID=A0A9Q1C159_HOLLE|nr:Ectonucleotide pyrophosphatase/phosphodiesterase family member 7 [Holothuria leucospilota]